MSSSHIGAYKSSNRIDPKLKRRLRRSEEWTAKRDEEVNRRRNLRLMSPCRELNVDLSMDSSVLETSLNKTLENPTSEGKASTAKLRQNKKQPEGQMETKTKEKSTKSSQASLERLKMLKKWKEEKALLKKQAALEKAKHKPFIVSVAPRGLVINTNFERKWEQEKNKKTANKQHAVPAVPATRTRSGATSAKSALTSTTSASQRITRQNASTVRLAAAPSTRAATTRAAAPSTRAATTRAAAPSTRAATTRAAAPSTRAATTRTAAPSTRAATARADSATRAAKPVPKPAAATTTTSRAASSTTIKSQPAGPKKVPPKTARAEPVRRSTRPSAKSEAETFPNVCANETTENQEQKIGETRVVFSDVLSSSSISGFTSDRLQQQPRPDSGSFRPPPSPSTSSASLFETPLLEEVEPNTGMLKKAVSFASEDFVFTAPEDLLRFETSPFSRSTLSPASAHSFFHDSDSTSSFSPKANNFITTRGSFFLKEKPEISSSAILETCKDVPEDEKASDTGEFFSSEKAQEISNAPSQDKSVDIPWVVVEESAFEDDCAVEKSEDLCDGQFSSPVYQGPRTRTTRRSLSAKRVKEVSTKGSRRRHKTEMPRPPRTPEEWVTLLSNSPMIEMNRRKISKEKLDNSPFTLKFTDDDHIAAKLTFQHENLPEETAQKDESCEKSVSLTESSPENAPEVSSVEFPLEPSVISQPEPSAANTEDKKDERPTESPPSTVVQHDVAYFRNLIKSETDSLNSLADEFETVIPGVSGDVEGQIRTVIGQTNLLISKRFRQFIGLIDNCEYNTGAKETTCDDLQGFWDMVDFQVDDLKTKFEELSKSRANNWQPLESNPPPPPPPVKKLVKKVAKPAPAKAPKGKGRSEFALFMAQKKKAAKVLEVKLSTTPSKMEQDSIKVFDGHFFKVESPVKSPKPHCEAEISGSRLAIPTFVETDRSVRLSPTISIVENGEDLNVDSSKTVCPEKEPLRQVEPKSPSSPAASPLVMTKSFRRSFLPAIPSPLLQDITPHKKGRESRKSFVFTDVGSLKRTVVTPRQNCEMENDQEPTEKIVVLQTPPLRRSSRMRKSVTSYSSPVVNKTPTADVIMQSFIKSYLSSDSSLGDSKDAIHSRSSEEIPVFSPLEDEGKNEKQTPKQKSRRRRTVGSQSSKDVIISVKSPEELPVFTPLKDEGNNKKPTPKQTSRRRKTVDSQSSNASPKRRRSTRTSRKSISSEQQTTDVKENLALFAPEMEYSKEKRGGKRNTKSVAFSEEVSTVTNTDSPSTVLSPVSPNVDTTEEEEELNKYGTFKTLKVGYTPVKGLRQSHTYTPRRSRSTNLDSSL